MLRLLLFATLAVVLGASTAEARGDAGQSVDAALSWLAKHQRKDGSWKASGWQNQCKASRCAGPGVNDGDKKHDDGVTALALLAFATAGHTHQEGPHKDTVKRALSYVQQLRAADGSIAFKRSYRESIYHHAIATQALALLYVHSGDRALEPAVKGAVRFCLEAQNPGLGWWYGVKTGRSDTSVTGWMALALSAGQQAGVEIPSLAFAGARAWFARATDEKGNTGYTAPAGGSSFLMANDNKYDQLPTMTAMGMLGRLECGDRPSNAIIELGRGLLLENLPVWEKRKINFYYWHAAARALNYFPARKRSKWHEALKKVLIPAQRKTGGCAVGSWDPLGEWCLAGGRVFATAINAMTLEALRTGRAVGALVVYHGGTLVETGATHRFEVLCAKDSVRIWPYDAEGKPLAVSGIKGKVRMTVYLKPKEKKGKKRKKMVRVRKPTAAPKLKTRKKSAKVKIEAAAPERGRLHGFLVARLRPGKKFSHFDIEATLDGVPGVQGSLTVRTRIHALHERAIFKCLACKHRHEDPGKCVKCGKAVR